MLPLTTGLPDLTSSTRHRHDLIYLFYYLLLAHRPPPHSRSSSLASAIVLVFGPPHRPRLRSAASSPPSQTSAMPCLKCFISLFGFGHPVFLSLYILCVLSGLVRHCYRNFLSRFVATPSGIGGRPFVSSRITSSFFFLIPLDCVFRVGFSLFVKRPAVVLFGFWCLRSYTVSQYPS